MKYSYALGVLAMVFAAACSSASASSSPSATSTPASGATGVTVDLTDANQLQPTTITASAGTTVVSLLVAGAAIAMNVLWLIPIAAAAMLWGHYWDAENVMTIPSMVAAPRYRGVASGFSYIHTKLPQFLGIFLFPAFFGGIGIANATFLTAVFPLVGLLAAIFILPEVYGYIEVRRSAPEPAQAEATRRAA